MLRELRIHNFVIIEELELQFSKGLTIFTGETGAGKSILVDAVELLVGGRSSIEQIRTGCDEAVLEAAFTVIPSEPSIHHIREMGLLEEGDDSIVIRRILSRGGRGRIYLNGGLIPLSLLQKVGEKLVDIHGQHEHQSLLKSDEQFELLDSYGKILPLRNRYSKSHQQFNSLKTEFEKLKTADADRGRSEDLLRFQYQEITSARLQPGEEEALEKTRRLLSQTDRLTQLSSEAYEILYDADGSILGLLSKIKECVHQLSGIDADLQSCTEAIESAEANLGDVARSLRSYRDRLEHDPRRLEETEDRLQLIGRLKKKYGATLEDILAAFRRVEQDLELLSNRDDRLHQLEGQIEKERKVVLVLAGELSHERRRVSRKLSKEIEKELKPLGMPKVKFEAAVSTAEAEEGLKAKGADQVDFLIAPNPGEEAKPIATSASGGELSRIMLAIKVIFTDVDPVPTLVFDEVDAGVGSAVAEAVGERLKRLSAHRQVFCITHLPQIAAYANTHVVIEKQVSSGRTKTQVLLLNGQDRIQEIARMLGGKKVTQTAWKHAKEMLDRKEY